MTLVIFPLGSLGGLGRLGGPLRGALPWQGALPWGLNQERKSCHETHPPALHVAEATGNVRRSPAAWCRDEAD